MISLAFPNMFTTSATRLHEDADATLCNTRLVLGSWKGSLFGDPFFGSNILRFIYEPNNIILQDIIIDELYLTIKTYIPQVFIDRKNIRLKSDGTTITAVINCINKLDNTPNMYEIPLTVD